jgi:hypothetical protein
VLENPAAAVPMLLEEKSLSQAVARQLRKELPTSLYSGLHKMMLAKPDNLALPSTDRVLTPFGFRLAPFEFLKLPNGKSFLHPKSKILASKMV